jgi:phosphoribosylanthranilate isomerase
MIEANIKVKICGITNLEDALLAEALGADAVGFIFYENSKRYVKPAAVKNISSKLSPFTMKVGVFVNEDLEIINSVAEKAGINTVQLHGEETPDFIDNIYYPVIKSFRIKNGFNFSELEKYKNVSYLLDTYSQKEYGGTGNKFDWEVIPEEFKRNIILAGGISSDNIEYIIQNVKPFAVDLSSSVEKEPGKKDEEKLTVFFNKIKNFRS